MDKGMLDYLTAIGAVPTPIPVLILSGFGWRVRTQLARRSVLEENLREDRIPTYYEILRPFIALLMSDAVWQSDLKNKGRDKNAIAVQRMLSLEYRELGFRLSLVGDDAVIWASTI